MIVPESSPAPVIELQCDPQVGLYCCVPDALAQKLQDRLEKKDEIAFFVNLARTRYLDRPGCKTFLFGALHPVWVQDLIAVQKIRADLGPEVVLPETTFQMPVSQLLGMGEPSADSKEEANSTGYRALGFSENDVPELIRMAVHEGLHSGPNGSKIVWAPVHAWRALGQLKAPEAILPLLTLLERIDRFDDEWIMTDIPSAFAGIGPAAIPALTDYLVNPANLEHARICASSALTEIAVCHPDSRAKCIARISSQLQRFREQDPSFNAFLISDLLDLQASEAAPTIEQAFARGKVDKAIVGDWEDVEAQISLNEGRISAHHHPSPADPAAKRQETFSSKSKAQASPSPAGADPSAVRRNDLCPCGSGRKFKKCCIGLTAP